MSKKLVIIGGGFGGLAAAKALKKEDVSITLIDKTNHHLFLPLLYQVATAMLAPAQVAAPIREIFRKQKNALVIMGTVEKIDLKTKQIHADNRQYNYDYLIISGGLANSYFAKDAWEEFAPSLKTLGDAIKIREKILLSLEKAESECSDDERKKHLTFVIVGGGPTGVEVAGAIAELTKSMLKDFKRVKPKSTRIILLEVLDHILCGFSSSLSAKGKKALEDLGVEVRLNVRITDINSNGIRIDDGFIETENVIWAAGARAQVFMQSISTETDKAGRIMVNDYCSVKGHPEVFVIGDAAIFMNSGNVLPATAPVAIQQGKYVSRLIIGELCGKPRKPFNYKDKGSMAIIGTHKAVLQSGKLEISGYLAWLFWMVLHICVIAEFRNRHMVLVQWLWYYTTRHPGVRLITGRK
ncbi:MAG: NAD(P)/FAD-dependent oxidoreductase [Dehalococcoidales bacterium]